MPWLLETTRLVESTTFIWQPSAIPWREYSVFETKLLGAHNKSALCLLTSLFYGWTNQSTGSVTHLSKVRRPIIGRERNGTPVIMTSRFLVFSQCTLTEGQHKSNQIVRQGPVTIITFHGFIFVFVWAFFILNST